MNIIVKFSVSLLLLFAVTNTASCNEPAVAYHDATAFEHLDKQIIQLLKKGFSEKEVYEQLKMDAELQYHLEWALVGIGIAGYCFGVLTVLCLNGVRLLGRNIYLRLNEENGAEVDL